jgi:hypothetical protein
MKDERGGMCKVGCRMQEGECVNEDGGCKTGNEEGGVKEDGLRMKEGEYGRTLERGWLMEAERERIKYAVRWICGEYWKGSWWRRQE